MHARAQRTIDDASIEAIHVRSWLEDSRARRAEIAKRPARVTSCPGQETSTALTVSCFGCVGTDTNRLVAWQNADPVEFMGDAGGRRWECVPLRYVEARLAEEERQLARVEASLDGAKSLDRRALGLTVATLIFMGIAIAAIRRSATDRRKV